MVLPVQKKLPPEFVLSRSLSWAKDYDMLLIDQNECIQCGACADVCPVECIPLQKVTAATWPMAGAGE